MRRLMVSTRSTHTTRTVRAVACSLALVGAVTVSQASPASADSTTVEVEPDAPAPLFAPLQSGRLLDTRPGATTIDGDGAGGGALAPGVPRQVEVAGRAGAEATSDAVVFNIVAVGATANGFVKAWACADPEPATSVLNFGAYRAPISNSAIVAVGSGDLCVSASATTHLIVDVVGQFVAGSGYTPDHRRVLDSRLDYGPEGLTLNPTLLHAHEWRKVLVLSSLPSQAVFNFTVVNPAAAGYAALAGCDQTPPAGQFDPSTALWTMEPSTSSVNFAAHQTVANLVIDRGTMGGLCLFSSVDTHVIVDLVGGFPVQSTTDSPSFGLTRGRILDSRRTHFEVGNPGPAQQLPAGVTELHLWDEHGANEEQAMFRAAVRALNVVAVGATANGYLTFFPCGEAQPGTSTMNFESGRTTAHLSFLPQADDRSVCVFASTPVHLVIDGQAWFMTSPQPLQLALSTGGCGASLVTTSTANRGGLIPMLPGPLELRFALDVVGGTGPYDVTVDTPTNWTATVESPSTDDPRYNVDVTVTSDAAGITGAFSITLTVVDEVDASAQIQTQYAIGNPIPTTC